MTTTQLLPKILKQRKFLMILPLLIIAGLFIAFYSRGGGETGKKDPAPGYHTGFNTELPKALFDNKEEGMTKIGYYKKSDEDSIKRRQSQQLDPYHGSFGQLSTVKVIGSSAQHTTVKTIPPTGNLSPSTGPLSAENPKAGELLKKLEQLRQSVQKPRVYRSNPAGPSSMTVGTPANAGMPVSRPPEVPTIARLERLLRGGQLFQGRPADSAQADPQLERLNKMLDKVIQIQHARSGEAGGAGGAGEAAGVGGTAITSPETIVDPPPSNTIPAVVEEDQTLVSGTTIALRLTEEVMINGVRIPGNQLVYGLVSINNDRMLITINSIRHDQSIYTTALQVYDMDGLPGIHIPGMLSRDVAKQSADQGISALNLATFSPSIGAQAANAGIQATKSLFSRKIRLVRVSVQGGYRVLLRNMKGSGVSTRGSLSDSVGGAPQDSIITTASQPFSPFLHRSVTEGNVELTLQGIYLRDGLMWLSFRLKNQSPIGYAPEYTRCCIRERKKMKRTAIQEIPLQPVIERLPRVVPGGTEQVINLGFRPFTLSKDKKLALQVAERDGGRELNLSIPSKILLKAK